MNLNYEQVVDLNADLNVHLDTNLEADFNMNLDSCGANVPYNLDA